MKLNEEYEVIPFATAKDFREWLHQHHASSPGIWLKMFKKNTGITSITYKEALDEALCYGWIDGQAKPGDDQFWVQKFTPRRPKSNWSKRNQDHVGRLIKEKRMQPAGLEQIKVAKADGRWEQAYDSPSNMKVPADFIAELEKDAKALAFFHSLNKANTYAIAWRLQTAKKPETRAKRFAQLLEMMHKQQKLH